MSRRKLEYVSKKKLENVSKNFHLWICLQKKTININIIICLQKKKKKSKLEFVGTIENQK